MENEQTKKSKNFLGYDTDTMALAKPRSKYFIYVALLLMVVMGVIGKPIAPANSEWYIIILPEILGFLIGGVLLAMFIAWIARLVAKAFGKTVNKFDYFATTFLVMSALGFISKLFG